MALSVSDAETYKALAGHLLLLHDIHHIVKIDGGAPLQFSKMDYQLFITILKAENHVASYEQLFQHLYGGGQTERRLLADLRKRVSRIRLKLITYDIILASIRNYGYQLISSQPQNIFIES